jgi:hypothetical protein
MSGAAIWEAIHGMLRTDWRESSTAMMEGDYTRAGISGRFLRELARILDGFFFWDFLKRILYLY